MRKHLQHPRHWFSNNNWRVWWYVYDINWVHFIVCKSWKTFFFLLSLRRFFNFYPLDLYPMDELLSQCCAETGSAFATASTFTCDPSRTLLSHAPCRLDWQFLFTAYSVALDIRIWQQRYRYTCMYIIEHYAAAIKLFLYYINIYKRAKGGQ